MRTYLLLAVAALSLAACRNNTQTENTANVDQNLAAESIVTNDVTAIDAVTGDAANMAADVDINFTTQQQLNNGTNTVAPSSTRPSRPQTARPTSPQSNSTGTTPTPAQPATNTTTNSI
jgi:hypothetical protein